VFEDVQLPKSDKLLTNPKLFVFKPLSVANSANSPRTVRGRLRPCLITMVSFVGVLFGNDYCYLLLLTRAYHSTIIALLYWTTTSPSKTIFDVSRSGACYMAYGLNMRFSWMVQSSAPDSYDLTLLPCLTLVYSGLCPSSLLFLPIH
jgi:hypothetical protein